MNAKGWRADLHVKFGALCFAVAMTAITFIGLYSGPHMPLSAEPVSVRIIME